MKITVIDGHTMNPGDLSWKQYEQFGQLQVFRNSTDDEDEVIRRIGDSEIVIANKSKVTRRVIDACPQIRFITVQATGYDPVDYVYAREKVYRFLTSLHTGPLQWPSLRLPCCWKSAAMSGTMTRLCIRGAGQPAETGASGIIP